MKKRNKLILGSVMSIAMCASLIAGSTYALFSSESTTNIAITSGKVEVSATVDNLIGHSLDASGIPESVGTFTNGGTFSYAGGVLSLNLISPGDGVSFDLVVTNKSTISIKYQVQLQASNSDFSGENGLAVTVEGKSVSADGMTYATDWSDIVTAPTAEEELVRLPVTVELPEAAGNLYQDKSCEIKIAVLAYQGNAKTENPDPAATISLYNIADFKAFAKSVNAGTDYHGQTVKLMANVDFNAPEAIKAISMSYMLADALEDAADAWEPIGTSGHPFRGIFDGNGHIIANFAATATDDAQAAGFFGYVDGATIEHLHFTGANVSAAEGTVAAVVVGQAQGDVHFIDVTVEGTCEAKGNATVGGLVGELLGEETTLTIEDSSFEGSGAEDFVGDMGADNNNVNVSGSTFTDGEGNTSEWDENGKPVHKVSAAQELVDLVNNGLVLPNDKIVLTEDLDFTDVQPAGKAYMTKDCLFEIDGKDGDEAHTISGLKYALFLYVKGGSYLHDFTIDLDVNLTNPADNKLARGAIAENIVPSDTSSEVTVENILIKGNAVNMRAAFFDESGEDGSTGTLNFIKCRSEVNMTSTGSSEITKVSAFLNLPDAWDVNFTDCVNTGALTYNAIIISNAVMAGFVSYPQGNGNNTLTFTRCINAGKIELNYVDYGFSSPDVGGFIGKVQRSTNVKFVDCANTASVCCIYTSTTISIGGFVGQSTGGSVTFEGTNVNGSYTGSGDGMVADADMGKIVVSASGGEVRAGGFVGYPGSAAITVKGTLVNAGEVTVEQRESSTFKFIAYAGGLFGHTAPSVTFADDCAYYNLGKVTVTVAHATGSVVYLGGIVGYVSGNTYSLGTSTGYNAGTLSVSGSADTVYTGAFVGCIYNSASSGLTDETLANFTAKGEVEAKIGHANA